MSAKKKTYSYIKHPFCKNGWYSFSISMLSFILTQFIVYRAVSSGGEVSMGLAALGISALLIDIAGMSFTRICFKEKNKNYAFAVLGGLIGLFVFIEWIYIFSR
ncbi:MAG: hypothetical protein MR011_00815 [Lachnospiraceae bacterium]|nr:hypothetical protein [Lachnospiraceae bacterium]